MSDKLKKIYEALIDGAEEGLSGSALYKHVVAECPKATSKKVVKASLLALTDKDLKDENVLRVIYDLAIRHRLDPAADSDEDADDTAHAPTLKVRKRRSPEEAPASSKDPDEVPG